MTPEKVDPVDRREFFNIIEHQLVVIQNLRTQVDHMFKAVLGLTLVVVGEVILTAALLFLLLR